MLLCHGQFVSQLRILSGTDGMGDLIMPSRQIFKLEDEHDSVKTGVVNISSSVAYSVVAYKNSLRTERGQ